MPSAPPTPAVSLARPTWPPFAPTYPKAGPAGMLVVALAYFSLGVAVGALLKASPRGGSWFPLLIVPGLLAGIAFVAWVISTLL